MKRIAILMMLASLSVARPMAVRAQSPGVAEYERESREAYKKQQKVAKKAARKQLKLSQRALRKQQKAIKKYEKARRKQALH